MEKSVVTQHSSAPRPPHLGPDSRPTGSGGSFVPGGYRRRPRLFRGPSAWGIGGIVLGLVLGVAGTSWLEPATAGRVVEGGPTEAQRTSAAQPDISEVEESNLEAANAHLELRIAGVDARLAELAAELRAREPLPNLLGLPVAEVEALAEELGWQLTVEKARSEKPKGTVLSQEPAAGTLMGLGTSFTILVAKPRPPRMPNLVGQMPADAEAVAEQFGWAVTVTGQSSSLPAGTILSQTPSAGTLIRGAGALTIVIAKKPPAPESASPEEATPVPASSCHSSYAGACLKGDASDYDCAGGSGNGPYYVEGPVTIVGADVFDLDSDGDGVGCES